MANAFFNLTLDTQGPVLGSNGFKINDGNSITTTVDNIRLTIDCTSSDVTLMKIWGVAGAENKNDATWETYSTQKTVSLPSSENSSYTIHLILRDDVYNESEEFTASITLSTELPNIIVVGPDISKIGTKESSESGAIPKNVCGFTFTSSVALKAWKVKLVPATNSQEDAGVQIGTTYNSAGMTGGALAASTVQNCTINGSDLKAACGSADGTYVIKVFGQSAENDLWSA